MIGQRLGRDRILHEVGSGEWLWPTAPGMI
jgi:hypothetical protein